MKRARGDRLHQRWSLQGAQLGWEEVLMAGCYKGKSNYGEENGGQGGR